MSFFSLMYYNYGDFMRLMCNDISSIKKPHFSEEKQIKIINSTYKQINYPLRINSDNIGIKNYQKR